MRTRMGMGKNANEKLWMADKTRMGNCGWRIKGGRGIADGEWGIVKSWNSICKVAPCSSFTSVTSFKTFLINHYNVLLVTMPVIRLRAVIGCASYLLNFTKYCMPVTEGSSKL